MTPHLWRSESSLTSAIFPRRERESECWDGEGGSGRRMTVWSGGSIVPRWLKFPACQVWWIWLKIKESRGPWRADEWMNELCCSFTHYPIQRKTLPNNPRRQLWDFLPRFRTKMFWYQAWLKEVHSRNKRPPFFQSPDSEKAPGRERERDKRDTKHPRKTGDSSAFSNATPFGIQIQT